MLKLFYSASQDNVVISLVEKSSPVSFNKNEKEKNVQFEY